MDTTASEASTTGILSSEQIATFLRDGVLVVDDVLTPHQVQQANCSLMDTLEEHGVRDAQLIGSNSDESSELISADSVRAFQGLSSTNGSGGVLDLFYADWKFQIASNARLWRMTKDLWKAAYCHNDETLAELGQSGQQFRWQPYGAFNPDQGYMYVDRIGYRLPTKVSEELGRRLEPHDETSTAEHHKEEGQQRQRKQEQEQHTSSAKMSKNAEKRRNKRLKNQSLQRSLTPHLDCCPDTYYQHHNNNTSSNNNNNNNNDYDENNDHAKSSKPDKWRPIQCFVSLTDNQVANTGGFEAAKGFHLDFDEWRKSRSPTIITRKIKKQQPPRRHQQQHKKNGIYNQANRSHQSSQTNAYVDTVQGHQVGIHKIHPPCVGEYTHIRPKEDSAIMERVVHIPVRAGSAVFWDNRIPHANAYRHDGASPRAVVYCSFLPDIELNRQYAATQLAKFRAGIHPTDQWIRPNNDETERIARNHISNDNDDGESRLSSSASEDVKTAKIELNELAKKLMGLESW